MSDLASIERALGDLLGHRPRRATRAHLQRLLEELDSTRRLSHADVAARLRWDLGLAGQLAHAITVDETFFLRYPEHFETLVAHVRRREREGTQPVVIWSVGCSTGEEPYSMAIAIDRALGSAALRSVRIVAMDVDSQGLQKAAQGTYGPWSFRGTEPGLRQRYFEPVGEDRHRVIERVRSAVTFEHAELQRRLRDVTPDSVDAVFFRNVTIYLTPEATRAVHDGLARALRPGGLLVLGPGDTLPHEPRYAEKDVAVGFVPRPARSSFPLQPRTSPRPPAPAPSPVTAACSARGVEPPHAPRLRAASAAGTRLSTVVTRARALADGGDVRAAIAELDVALQAEACAAVLGLRGCLHLANATTDQGLADLRSALYLAPSDAWLRYQYALGLHALGRDRAARSQVTAALESLAESDDDRVLADEEITVGALRRAAREFLQRLP